MVPVRVIAAGGATLRGPATVKLSRDQWARREAVLGPVPKRVKAVDLDGGQALTFKLGEEFEIEAFEGRLNPALFEDITPAEEAEVSGSDTDEGDEQSHSDDADQEGGDEA